MITSKKKTYSKPKLKKRKIKMSLFFTKAYKFDDFSIFESVYASMCAGCSSTDCADCHG
jgi:hypothetical protein